MATIIIKITPSEKSRLLSYCEGVHDSGHWGDGAVELPDEKILEDRIRSAEGVLELTLRDLDILKVHIEDSTDHGFVLLPEDSSLIRKLLEALETQHHSALNMFERIGRAIDSFTVLLPNTRRAVQGGTSSAAETSGQAASPGGDAAVTSRADTADDPAEPPGNEVKGLLARLKEFFSPPPVPGNAAPGGAEPTFEERVKRAKAVAQKISRKS